MRGVPPRRHSVFRAGGEPNLRYLSAALPRRPLSVKACRRFAQSDLQNPGGPRPAGQATRGYL
jgi:hypothetical protein